jgi:enoyl-CoA hydratase
MTDERPVLLHVDGHIATITLNNPAKLNAIGPGMLAELEGAVAELERTRAVRAVVLTGSGERAFSVGADIGAWSALEPLDMWRSWIREGHRVFARVAALRQPVIAALNGYAFGGGLELALAADIRLAATTAELALPEVKIGAIPGWGGTSRLRALIGAGRAKQLIFTGARLDAARAERWGLVNEAIVPGELAARAQSLARDIAANAPVSVQLAKQLIDGHDDPTVTLEALASAVAASTADGREGVASFREKRAPRFEGY